MLFKDMPSTVNQENVLKRARQLVQLRYTPRKPLPVIVADKGVTPTAFIPVHLSDRRPVTGANYSAARFDEKYLGLNVSLETFMTAMENPESVLYTRSLHGRSKLCAAWYGTVCSEFVSYCFDLPFQIDCQQWPFLDGIRAVDPADTDALRLCDILNERTRHTALITGIERDEGGHVVRISVSESTPPQCIETCFTAEEFRAYWLNDGYEVLRFPEDRPVSYTPSAFVALEGDPVLPAPVINRILLPDYGDKANYMLGSQVVFTLFDAEYSAVRVESRSAAPTVLAVSGNRAVFTPAEPGMYSACAVKNDGVRSDPVFFAVTDTRVVLPKKVYAPDEPVIPSFSCPAEDACVGWVVKTDAFAKYWGYPVGRDGSVPSEARLPAGKYLIISMYKNGFGVYSSSPCFFEVQE